MEKLEVLKPQPVTLDQLKSMINNLGFRNDPTVITISGPSGSGKSTLSDRLTQEFPANVIIHTDDYYIGKSRMAREMPAGEEMNFDHPASIDISRIISDLTQLKNGEEIIGARYDMVTMEPFVTGRQLTPQPLIIIEGLVANNPALREHGDLSILTKSDLSERLQHIIERDKIRNGRDAEDTIRNFSENAEPSYRKYFASDDSRAEYVIKREEFEND